jgi:hypothetical protein
MKGDPLNAISDTPIVRLQEAPRMEDFISCIYGHTGFHDSGSQFQGSSPILLAMPELSLVIDKAAELLRNDSLINIMKRLTVYRSILNLVEKIGAHHVLLRLVQDDLSSKT